MARSAKELVQRVTDDQNVKNVDKAADRDGLLNNIDRMTHLQEIYKKIDSGITLTDEERDKWQHLNKTDKMRVIDAYNGVDMNMREPTTFANLDTHSKDYSDLEPKTSPKDLEKEKVFNPSKPDIGSHLYSELQALVSSLKVSNMDPAIIKNVVANVLDAKGLSWDKTIDTVDGGTSKISDVVNEMLQSGGAESPSENWDQAKAKGGAKLKSDEEQARLEEERKQRVEQAAAEKEVHDTRQKDQRAFVNKQGLDKIKDKAWRAYVKQNMEGENYTPTLEGFKSFNDEVNPDKTDTEAVLARQPDDKVEVKNLENILKDSPEPGYAQSLRDMIIRGKEAGKSYNEIIWNDLGEKGMAKLYRMTDGDRDKVDDVMTYLSQIYDNKTADINSNIQEKLSLKEKRANTAGARALDAFDKAVSSKESVDELPSEDPKTKSYFTSGERFNKGPKTQLQRVLSGDKDQKRNQAIKNAIQNPKAVEALLQDGRLNDILDSARSKFSPEFWLKYFKDNPKLSFRIVPNRDMMRNGTFDFVGEREGHGNSYSNTDEAYNNAKTSGKAGSSNLEILGKEDPFHLLTGDDINNFLQAYSKIKELNALKRKALQEYNASYADDNTPDELQNNYDPMNMPLAPEFNFISDEGIDSQEDAEFRARVNKMLETGDPRYMYQDPKKKTVTNWDPKTGLFTEINLADAIKNAKTPHKMGYTIDDNYYNKLLNALNSSNTLQDAINYNSGNPAEGNPFDMMETSIREKFGDDSAAKAKQLFRDLFSFNNVLSDTDINKLDSSTPFKDALVFGPALSTTVLRQLQNKFGKFREKYPEEQLANAIKDHGLYDILTNGFGYDISDTLDPRWYKDYVTGKAKVDKWQKSRGEDIASMIDSDKLKKWLKYNLDEIKKARGTKDYSKFGNGLDDAFMEKLEGDFEDSLLDLYGDNEKKDLAARVANNTAADIKSLPSLMELYKDKYNDLVNDYVAHRSRLDALVDANNGKADTPEIKQMREALQELGHEISVLKTEKIPIRKLADEKFDGDYYAAEQEYLHPSESDDLDTWYRNVLANKSMKHKLKGLHKEDPDKYKRILGVLENIRDNYSDAFPGLSDWIATLSDYEDPGKVYEILKSQDASMSKLGLTPQEFSALRNNKESITSKTQDKNRRKSLVGQRKVHGSLGSDAYTRADQVADIIQNAENTGRIDDLRRELVKQDVADIVKKAKSTNDIETLRQELGDDIVDTIKKAKDTNNMGNLEQDISNILINRGTDDLVASRNAFEEAKERLKHTLDGIFADRPGEK